MTLACRYCQKEFDDHAPDAAIKSHNAGECAALQIEAMEKKLREDSERREQAMRKTYDDKIASLEDQIFHLQSNRTSW